MSKNIFLIIILTMTSVLNENSVKNLIDEHIDTYAEYNQTHHDNIDDNVESHAHTHRHSENEEEHEHHHDHELNIAPLEVYFLGEITKIPVSRTSKKIKQGQFVKNLNSSAHPTKLLRPPIC